MGFNGGGKSLNFFLASLAKRDVIMYNRLLIFTTF